MVGWVPSYDGPDSGTTTIQDTTDTTWIISYNTTYDDEIENSINLEWWEKEKKKIKDNEKMRSKWKDQKKQHRFHQPKWGHNRPR